MNIGDKVRILTGIRTGQTGTIELINDIADYLIKVEDGDTWYDESELEPISDHMTEDELAEEELDEIKAAEFERGYRYGINSVITNIQRFLKEITP